MNMGRRQRTKLKFMGKTKIIGRVWCMVEKEEMGKKISWYR